MSRGVDLRIQLRRPGQSLDVRARVPGGITAVCGPSGAGKTTVLRVIAGLEPAVTGTLHVNGVPWLAPGLTVPPHKRGAGYCFQDSRVLPHLTVRANLHYGGWMQRLRGLAFRRPFSVDELAERLELGPLMRRRAFRLSGGETRRVAFARALLSARTLLLLDEPFAGLDRPLRAAVRALTAEFHTRTGLPVLLATHHMSSVTALTPRALLLEQGHSVGCGALDDLAAHPATAESARRLGLPAGPARRRPRGDAVS